MIGKRLCAMRQGFPLSSYEETLRCAGFATTVMESASKGEWWRMYLTPIRQSMIHFGFKRNKDSYSILILGKIVILSLFFQGIDSP